MSFKIGDIVMVNIKTWPGVEQFEGPDLDKCLWKITDIDELPPGGWVVNGSPVEYLLELHAPAPGRLWSSYPKRTWAWPEWIAKAPEMLVLAYNLQDRPSTSKRFLQRSREKRERKQSKAEAERDKRVRAYWASQPTPTTTDEI